MTQEERGNRFIIFGFIFWLSETAYFGYNFMPLSFVEKVCDDISVSAIITGFILIIIHKIKYP